MWLVQKTAWHSAYIEVYVVIGARTYSICIYISLYDILIKFGVPKKLVRLTKTSILLNIMFLHRWDVVITTKGLQDRKQM